MYDDMCEGSSCSMFSGSMSNAEFTSWFDSYGQKPLYLADATVAYKSNDSVPYRVLRVPLFARSCRHDVYVYDKERIVLVMDLQTEV